MTLSLPGGLQSLARLVLGQDIFGQGSNFIPGELDVARLSESGTDGQTQEVRVPNLGWHEMDHSVAVDALQKSLISLVGALQRDTNTRF